MISVAIVEDEKAYGEQMAKFIFNYGKERGEKFEVFRFMNGEDFLRTCASKRYDVVFMDIILPEYDGLEISRRFREIDGQAALVFVTNMAQYAIIGYEVDALDFLVKPVTYTNFCVKMTKVVKSLRARSGVDVLLKSTSGGVYRISSTDICYVESFAHYLEYHVIAEGGRDDVEVITVRSSMGQAERELSSKMIVKCHKSFLVNLAHMIKVEQNCVLVKDAGEPRAIPISRTNKVEFMKKMLEFYKG